MGWPSTSCGGQRRRWTRRSCRTGGSGGVVTRTVATPAPCESGVSADWRRTKGFGHVDKQQRVHGILSDSISSSGTTTEEEYLCSDFSEYKRKRSSGNSTRCLPSEHIINKIESCHSLPSVIAELMDFDAATGALIASQKTSYSWSKENMVPSNEKVNSSNAISYYELTYRPKFRLGKYRNNVKHAPLLKNATGTSNFSYRLARSAERFDSIKMSPTSSKCSFSDKMSQLHQSRHVRNYQNCAGALHWRHKIAQSRGAINMLKKEEIHKQSDPSTRRHRQTLLDNALVRFNQLNYSQLRQPRHDRNYHNQNRVGAFNWRHKIAQSGGATNMLKKEEIHKQSDPSTRRHWQSSLDNSLVRCNQLYCPQPPNEESSEHLWSCSSSESEKVVCFSSSGSIDDFHVSFSSDTSDTSDNSKLYYLGLVVNDQWKMNIKKDHVHCPLAARSMYVIYCKEREQPSPVSVLERLAEDFSDAETTKRDSHLRPDVVNFPSAESLPEMVGSDGISDYVCSEMEASENNKTIQLVEDILEEFVDEEERDFSYLLDILIASGIHGIKEDQLCRVCQSLDSPAGYDVFEKLEKKYIKVTQWSRADRKLFFDNVNSILSEILAPCLDMRPWVNIGRSTAPAWGSEGLLEKVLQILAQRCEELAPSKRNPEPKRFDDNLPDLADCIDRAGRDLEKMIRDDLLEELLLELMSS